MPKLNQTSALGIGQANQCPGPSLVTEGTSLTRWFTVDPDVTVEFGYSVLQLRVVLSFSVDHKNQSHPAANLLLLFFMDGATFLLPQEGDIMILNPV